MVANNPDRMSVKFFSAWSIDRMELADF